MRLVLKHLGLQHDLGLEHLLLDNLGLVNLCLHLRLDHLGLHYLRLDHLRHDLVLHDLRLHVDLGLCDNLGLYDLGLYHLLLQQLLMNNLRNSNYFRLVGLHDLRNQLLSSDSKLQVVSLAGLGVRGGPGGLGVGARGTGVLVVVFALPDSTRVHADEAVARECL